MKIRKAKEIVVKLRNNPDLSLTRDASTTTGRYEVSIRQNSNAMDDGNAMTPHEARRLARAIVKMADHVEASNRDWGES